MLKLKYFAKYLPVEGEIKEGTLVYFNGFGYDKQDWKDYAGFYTLQSGKYYSVAPEKHPIIRIQRKDENDLILKVNYNIPESNCAPHKVFLCSKDIQVGDIAYNDKFYPYPNGQLINNNSKVMDHGMMEVDSFKVIGEISPDAMFVTEGDEFDENELCCFIADGFNSGAQRHTLPFTAKKGQNKLYYGIKGPCGHFH